MTPGKPSPVGKGSFRFEDARGAYERREFPLAAADSGKHLYVNILFTKARLIPLPAQLDCHQLFAHSVPVYLCTCAASSSLAVCS